MKAILISALLVLLTACSQTSVDASSRLLKYDPVTPIPVDRVNFATKTIDYY